MFYIYIYTYIYTQTHMYFAGLCSLLFERVANVSIGISYTDKRETETGLSKMLLC